MDLSVFCIVRSLRFPVGGKANEDMVVRDTFGMVSASENYIPLDVREHKHTYFG